MSKREAAARLRALAMAIDGALAGDEGIDPWVHELWEIAEALDPGRTPEADR